MKPLEILKHTWKDDHIKPQESAELLIAFYEKIIRNKGFMVEDLEVSTLHHQ